MRLRLGVRVLHGRPYHPQTQSKDERFHRTLKAELIERHGWSNLAVCAKRFPGLRHAYNHERPHDSLGGATPATRYRTSPRALPEVPLALEYARVAVTSYLKTATTHLEMLHLRRMNVNEIVTVDPDVMSGEPCFAGTRVPVRTLFDYLKGGDSLDGFLDQFPTVSRGKAIACLERCRRLLVAAVA